MKDENGNMPASPMDSASALRAEEGHYDVFAYGLTKREHFAAMAMQGIISSGNLIGEPNKDLLAKHSTEYADSLLKALHGGES